VPPARSFAAAIAIMLFLLIPVFTAMPAGAQSQGVAVKNALVMLAPAGKSALQPILEDGGTPSSLDRSLSFAENLLSTQVLRSSTGAIGNFSIAAPIGESYNVSVSAPGFVSAEAGSSITVGDGGS